MKCSLINKRHKTFVSFFFLFLTRTFYVLRGGLDEDGGERENVFNFSCNIIRFNEKSNNLIV